MGVLFITHDIGVVADIAHRVVVLRHGKVVEQGTASKILNNPRDAYTRQLMDAVPDRGHVRTGGGEKTALLQPQRFFSHVQAACRLLTQGVFAAVLISMQGKAVVTV